MAKKRAGKIKIKYVRSVLGRPGTQRKVIEGLGFRKLNQVVERPDSPETWGMVRKVSHLVQVLEGEES
ncbi:MAG: 50S ribosomal protein L30 [Acidobacteriota bacterium]|jgi:large subunit ribosomal protein L30